jgi:hypothetical protein
MNNRLNATDMPGLTTEERLLLALVAVGMSGREDKDPNPLMRVQALKMVEDDPAKAFGVGWYLGAMATADIATNALDALYSHAERQALAAPKTPTQLLCGRYSNN